MGNKVYISKELELEEKEGVLRVSGDYWLPPLGKKSFSEIFNTNVDHHD